jgi:hypothetical protein
MSKFLLGVICGLVFGGIAAGIMIPMKFEDKRAAIIGAFINRFAIGFAIGASDLPVPGWLNGLIFGLLLSLPDAIITKAYIPILTLGVIGGVIIGIVTGLFGSK